MAHSLETQNSWRHNVNKVHLFLFTFESCCTVYGMMHLFKWMSSYYWFFPLPPFFFSSLWLCHWCRAAEISRFSTPAHILSVERISLCSPYSCCGETQAWICPRDPVESLSFLLAPPLFSVSMHLPLAQHTRRLAGYVAPFSYFLSPFPFAPSCAHIYVLPGWNSVRGTKKQG